MRHGGAPVSSDYLLRFYISEDRSISCWLGDQHRRSLGENPLAYSTGCWLVIVVIAAT